MERDVSHFLQDMIDMADQAAIAVQGKSFEDYQNNLMLRLGLERAVEIISEASKHIPEELKNQRPAVPWAKVRGIGNVLRHAYHGLSNKIIWGVIQDELPKLRVELRAILDSLDHPLGR